MTEAEKLERMRSDEFCKRMGFMTVAECAKLSDEQALKMAGRDGPALIGLPLFERAQIVQTVNPEGKNGPLIYADETEMRAKGLLPPKPGGRFDSDPQSPPPASSSAPEKSDEPTTQTEGGEDEKPLTDEEIEAELEKRRQAKRDSGRKMAPPVKEGEAPQPAIATIALNAEFDALTAVIDNPDSTPEARQAAEDRLAELTAPDFKE